MTVRGQTTHPLVGADRQPTPTDSDATDLDLAEAIEVPAGIDVALPGPGDDRLWVISTRSLTNNVCRADLTLPPFKVSRLSRCSQLEESSLEEYFAVVGSDRPIVIYVHGNRLSSGEAIQRANIIYRNIFARRSGGPIDWVVFSWPSAKQGMLIHDFREKARRTDTHGLYLAWLLKKHAETSRPTALIGYSFGGRMVTGALHALAGGSLARRTLPGPPVIGANFQAGLIAPAIESHWMVPRGYHGQATKNLNRLVLLYNRRDAVLKRYWLLDKVRGTVALGYTGPKSFGPRADGTRLFVRARDCARFVGLAHDEVDYYTSHCYAGSDMASMIHDLQTH